MKNLKYIIGGDKDTSLEFGVVETNEINPFKETRELEATFTKNGETNFVSFDSSQLDSLIDYLHRVREYAKNFDKESVKDISQDAVFYLGRVTSKRIYSFLQLKLRLLAKNDCQVYTNNPENFCSEFLKYTGREVDLRRIGKNTFEAKLN